MYRCANDVFKYCKGIPRGEIKAQKMRVDSLLQGKTVGVDVGNRYTCPLDPDTCGQCINHKELCGVSHG